MDDSRWNHLQQLFAQALQVPASGREAFIVQACADDTVLAADLRGLLASDDAGPDPVPAVLGRAADDWLHGQRRGLVGRRLGAWQLDAHIADGGMGSVFRAHRADGQYEQQAAVKLLNPALVSDEARLRLAAERQILARLSHPLIARLLDGGQTEDGAPYLVMEYVDGLPIDTWCDRQGLDTAARLRLFLRVCEAVDVAHRSLVVHRDLKPGNILVAADGMPRLLDFGIAKRMDGAGPTQAGQAVLTPSHASPEQITGGVITTATDIYALGVLLYDLLAGRMPHAAAGTHPVTLARAIVETDPPRPSDAITQGSNRRLQAAQARGERLTPQRLARELQGDLDNIVLMALRKDPARRYPSAQALADDIARCLAHEPVHARPMTLAYRCARFVRRHPVAVPVSALALVLVISGGALFTWRLAAERDRALAAEHSARRSAGFTASLLRGTGAEEDATRQVSVRDLLDKARQRVAQEWADDPDVAARLRTALGSAYSSWGAYAEAEQLLNQALQVLRERHPTPHADVAEVLTELRHLTRGTGDLEQSLAWMREAEAQWRQVGTPAERGLALAQLGVSISDLGRRSEAEPVLRQALAVLRQAHPGGEHPDIAYALTNLGLALHMMDRLDEAGPLFEQANAMMRRVGSPDLTLSEGLGNLALLRFDQGELAEAERLWRESLALAEKVFGPGGDAYVALSETVVGVVLMARGRFEEAARHTGSAMQTNLKLLGTSHYRTVDMMRNHAEALMWLGRLDESRALATRCLQLAQQQLPADHLELAYLQLRLADVLMRQQAWRGAEQALRAGLAVIAAQTTPQITPRDRMEQMLGQVLARQGRRDEGRALATRAVARMLKDLPPGHYRAQAAQVGLALRPFVAHPDPADEATARQVVDDLRDRLGPQAPTAIDLQAQLDLPG
jgi:eukaryotic-like serine/threonine-protein kinase